MRIKKAKEVQGISLVSLGYLGPLLESEGVLGEILTQRSWTNLGYFGYNLPLQKFHFEDRV